MCFRDNLVIESIHEIIHQNYCINILVCLIMLSKFILFLVLREYFN